MGRVTSLDQTYLVTLSWHGVLEIRKTDGLYRIFHKVLIIFRLCNMTLQKTMEFML